ncbi:MAG: hypothetical protein H6713_35555 [Myxococcales bacterium]|nr:hypothetical protein [Myxococcales bacterium]MCB9755287.1 hypothetical protein [Myxococcales bacterium]
MPRAARRLTVLALVFACQDGTGVAHKTLSAASEAAGPRCAAVVTHLFGPADAERDALATKSPSAAVARLRRESTRQECVREAWSPEAKECLLGQESTNWLEAMQAMRACGLDGKERR